MDLNYGPQYEDFKKEVQSFCNEYKDLRFVDSSQSHLLHQMEKGNMVQSLQELTGKSY